MNPATDTGGQNKRDDSRLADRGMADRALAWVVVLAALVVHFRVLSGGFLLDDFVHLFAVVDLPFTEALNHSGTQHLLQGYKLVIWLLHWVFGANAFAFFLFGLLLHLVNVRLLFEIVLRLTGKSGLAALVAGLWGMGPVISGTLGWISVHGQLYAASAVLWVLFDVVRYSQRPALLSPGLLLRHVALLIFAGTCFGTGLAMALVFFLLIACWNPVPDKRYRLVAVYGAVALILFLLYLYSGVRGDAPDPLTKLLRGGVEGLLVPIQGVAHLLSVSISGLFMGPILLGDSDPEESASIVRLATQFALAIVMPLFVLGIFLSGSVERRRLLALLLLPCAAYALIALARAGTVFGLRPEELRFHYASQSFITIALGLVLSSFVDRLPRRLSRWAMPLFVVILAASVIPFYRGLPPPMKAGFIKQQEKQYTQSMRKIEKAIQEQSGQSEIRIANEPFKVFIWKYTPRHFPGLAALFVVSYPDNVVDGKRVYFLEESPEVVQMYQGREGSRIAELLVHDTSGSGELNTD